MKQLDNTGAPSPPIYLSVGVACVHQLHLVSRNQKLPAISCCTCHTQLLTCLLLYLLHCLLCCFLLCPLLYLLLLLLLCLLLYLLLTVNKVDNNASDSMSVPQGSRRRCNCHASSRERATRVSPCKFSIIIVTFGQAQQQLQEIPLCVHLTGRQIRKQHCQHGFRWGVPPFKISI